MNVLVDTSIWSLALRRRADSRSPTENELVAGLTTLIGEGRARVLGVIRQELLSGIRSAGQYEKLRLYLRAFPDEPVETSDHEGAARLSNECRSKGITPSPAGVLICAVAIQRRWSIFSSDPDFSTYARVLPITLRPHRP